MKLFDDFERTFRGPAEYSKSDFDYLNRSDRIEAERIRALLEEWFERYPDQDKVEFASRFRQSDNRQFLSAFFELYLHALLSELDYEIEVHPDLPTSATRSPDFLAMRNGETAFYMEATLATGIFQ